MSRVADASTTVARIGPSNRSTVQPPSLAVVANPAGTAPSPQESVVARRDLAPAPLPARQPNDQWRTLLCWLAVANPVVVQLSFFLSRDAQSLGMHQLLQGCIFLAALFVCLFLPRRSTTATVRFGWLFAGLSCCCAIFLAKKAMLLGMRDTEFAADAVIYLKLLFGPLMWWLTAIMIQTATGARRLLRCIAIGGLSTAAIVFVCYLLGVGVTEAYLDEQVRATAGMAGVSNKQLAGFLAPCSFLALYLGRSHYSILTTVAALLMFLACLVTYTRAVQVGIILAILWLLLWRVCLARRRVSENWSIRLLVCGSVVAGVLFCAVGVEGLLNRWTLDFIDGRGGSGRLAFWQHAWTKYWDSPLSDLLTGIGYSSTKTVIFEVTGLYIHTHSDWFDMMLLGGAVGLIALLAVYWVLLRQFTEVPWDSPEAALIGAVLAVYGVMSLITGLLSATHAMFCVGAIIHCCRLLADQRLTASRIAVPNRPEVI